MNPPDTAHPREQATLQDLALFVEVARTGSFSKASRHLGIPGATLSRRIAAMEQRLGVLLFDRSTRRVELTEAARRYFDRCAPLVDAARLAQEALREAADQPVGVLRVSMPVDLGMLWLAPLLPAFATAYPAVSFALDLSPHHTDLIADHIDVAIRIGEVAGDRLIAKRLGEIDQGLYASPAYLQRHGRPRQASDLAKHECLTIGNSTQRDAVWRLQLGEAEMAVVARGRFSINNIGMIKLLCERGMGVALLPSLNVRNELANGRLERVLDDYTLPPLPVQAVLSSRLQSAAVRAFIAFLTENLPSKLG